MINSQGYLTIAIVIFCLLIAIADYFDRKLNGYIFSKWLWWDFSGFRLICSKINPALQRKENRHPPATFMLWIIGIYVAFFSVASQRYENRIDIIENRANAIFAQLATNTYKKALSRIANIQQMRCPVKPDILSPPSVFESLVNETAYEDMVALLKETLEDWKLQLDEVVLEGAELKFASFTKANLQGSKLQRANLQGANLQMAILEGANLQEAILQGADLQGAHLQRADLKGANLQGANLQGANLEDANLKKADLQGANLQGAILQGAILQGAKGLNVNQICEVRKLCGALMDSDLKTLINNKCPQLLKY